MKRTMTLSALLTVLGVGVLSVGAVSAHGWAGGFGEPRATPQEIAQHQEAMFNQQAEFLGLSADEVKDAWAQGKDFRDLAKEKGITEDQLKEKMKAQMEERMKAHLQALVDQGVITQAQADQRQQTMKDKPFAKHFGRRGGQGKGPHLEQP